MTTMTMNDLPFEDFLERKTQLGGNHGFKPNYLPAFLFDFQAALVEWAVMKGRAAIFADCGLGKTPMEFVWAENVIRHTNGRVLIATPLAVAMQMQREAEKFGFAVHLSRDGKNTDARITITNYEQLHRFDPNDFDGMVCDESSILKNFDGTRKAEITAFMRKMRYRLLATATAAPNDYIELGTSSEALGYLGYMDMLGRFFKNAQNTIRPMVYRHKGKHHGDLNEQAKWRFRGHAELPFWRWVCSWARALRKPSDLGFNDDGFILPPLDQVEHLVDSATAPEGMLFNLPAIGLKEQRDEHRRTIQERCEKVADLVNETGEPAVVWCHLNPEGDLLESLIPGAVQVSGKDSDHAKEDKLMSFSDGKTRVLITKPKIGAWGLNWQHCAHVTYFSDHSFEQYYQAVRRCWRFGQKRAVRVDMITTEGDADVLKNLNRKAEQADKMFANLVNEMNDALSIDRAKAHNTQEAIPEWLFSIN